MSGLPTAAAGTAELAARRLRTVADLIKPLLFIVCLIPLARLFVLGFNDALGANPVEFVTRSTGTWTLVMLCVTLAVTPLRRLLGWNALLRYRRMLGLFAFFYACLHFTTYIWFDQWFDLGDIARDIVKRPFITVGFSAFLLLLPLAITSTNRMQRRLGRRWQRLHRLIYLIVVLAVLHFWWKKAGKNDIAEPMIYACVVAVLLGSRIWLRLLGNRGREAGRGEPRAAIQRGNNRSDA